MRKRQQRVIFLADCQSFYASVEKASHPAYRTKPLVVSGDPSRRSGIILAACPLAKAYGVTTAEPLWQAQQKCPEVIVTRPRMSAYIRVSLAIMSILESYSDLVEPFSIDEQFVDVTASLSHFNCTPAELARHIQMRVREETGIYTRIGIGRNKILAKMACDNFAKKNESGIYELDEQHLDALWARPVNSMFGIGSRTMRHLARLGIHTIGELAQTPLGELKRKMKRHMKKNCDIWCEVLWRTANGMDDSPVTPDAFDGQKGIGRQTTLPVDYHAREDIDVVLNELSMLICERARAKGYMGTVVHAGAQGADFDRPVGFSRQLKLPEPSQISREVYDAAKKLFDTHWDGGPVRKIWISLGELQSDEVYQPSLFGNRDRLRHLELTMDGIRHLFGPASVYFGSSLRNTSQLKFLNAKIGGHYK
ncbi:DNA polymerase IV [Paenibacillus sp. F411]|uniref:DNA polymerase IV n=1 Tax=Paenibacillus algicola TaxID=2565926 RepID=A0A4P8XLL8_9BACL|nr:MULTISPECIES: DNA polymerase IV [Paenibacillus]MBO2944987.1 DNA polymerase IV [Paenibacillus sp. F411]QCT02381.1 DNA polymerase IV [Paenibacillus algicola]